MLEQPWTDIKVNSQTPITKTVLVDDDCSDDGDFSDNNSDHSDDDCDM